MGPILIADFGFMKEQDGLLKAVNEYLHPRLRATAPTPQTLHC